MGTHLSTYAVRLRNKARVCYTFKAGRCVLGDIFLRFGLDLLVSGLLKLPHLLLHWTSYQRAHFLHIQTHVQVCKHTYAFMRTKITLSSKVQWSNMTFIQNLLHLELNIIAWTYKHIQCLLMKTYILKKKRIKTVEAGGIPKTRSGFAASV